MLFTLKQVNFGWQIACYMDELVSTLVCIMYIYPLLSHFGWSLYGIRSFLSHDARLSVKFSM